MLSSWRSYSLRTLLLFVTLVAIALGLYVRRQSLLRLASEHHYQALDYGYQAAAIQRPVDPEWEWKFPSELRLDRATLVEVAPLWQHSRYCAELRDYYLAAARRPWLPPGSPPPVPQPVAIPSPLAMQVATTPEAWWQATFGAYVEANPCLLEPFMGFPPDDPNLELAQELLTDEQFTTLANRFQERRDFEQRFGRIKLSSGD
jgi:hypothetical protein